MKAALGEITLVVYMQRRGGHAEFISASLWKLIMENQTRNILINALAACDNKEILENTFERFQENDLQTRIDCMNSCMGSPKTFFSADENISLYEKYKMTMQMFLTGAWRIFSKSQKVC